MMWGGHGHIKQPLKIRRLKATTTSFTVNIKKHKTLLPRGLTVFVTRSDFFLAPQDASSGGRGGVPRIASLSLRFISSLLNPSRWDASRPSDPENRDPLGSANAVFQAGI